MAQIQLKFFMHRLPRTSPHCSVEDVLLCALRVSQVRPAQPLHPGIHDVSPEPLGFLDNSNFPAGAEFVSGKRRCFANKPVSSAY